MKKRFMSILLAAVMMLSLAACGTVETPTPAPEKEENPFLNASPVTIDGLTLGGGLVEEMPADEQLDENPDRDIDRAVEPIKPVHGTMLDGKSLNEEFYYYRSTLDSTKQQAYDLLRAGMLAGKEKIPMTVPIPVKEIFAIYKMVIYDSPELFWCEINGSRYAYNNKGIVTYYKPGYNDLVKDIAGNTAKLEAEVSDALADIWSLSTDAEKAKYAHDFLTHGVSYDLNAPYNQAAYSSLVNRSSVCAGYTHGFQYLMQKVGIPCAYVLGYTPGGYHAWNIVKLNGEYYAMDVTWDDPVGAPEGKYFYNYFNITDKKLASDHARAEGSLFIPVAEGTSCSFQTAFGGKAYGTDFEAIVGIMPEKIPADTSNTKVEDNPYLS